MRKFHLVSLCVIASMLGGCGMIARHERQEAMAKAQADVQAANAQCDEQFPPGHPEHAVARAKCGMDAARPLRQFATSPDLFDNFWAHRVLIAEKVQAGKLTVAEANVQIADLQTQLTNQDQQRNLANRSVGAQETAANAAYRSTMPVSCTRTANTTTCY
jgi:hypothetical protein